MQILYCRIGWMNFYRGLKNDQIANGGNNDDKFEVYNFLPHHDKYFGFVEPMGSIHIERLGAGKNDNYVKDILVVWIATSPEEGGMRIVGWYRDATVYREFAKISESYLSCRDDKRFNLYNISADEAVFLHPEERNFIFDGEKRPGQKNIWYGDEEVNNEVLNYIESYELEMENGKVNFLTDAQSHIEDKAYMDAATKIDFLYEENGVTEDFASEDKWTATRNAFKKRYNVEALKRYNDIDIWNKIWNHGQGGMIYALRNDPEFRMFGSAQSQDVARLPMHLTRDGNYYAGKNNEIIGQRASLEYAAKFRNKFVSCIEAIGRMELETVDDFIKLGDYLDENLDGKGQQMWVHKYLHMIFPDKFSQFHSKDFKRDALCALGIVPIQSFYGMAGQLYQIKKYTKINDFTKFAQVMYKNFPGIGKDEIYIINTRDNGLNIVRGWEQNSEVDVYTNLFENLGENPRFQQKTSTDDPRNHIYVVVHNGKPLGIIDRLRPKTTKENSEVRYGIWHSCFGEEDRISIDAMGKKNRPLTDPETIILIYARYFNNYYKLSELEELIRSKIDKYSSDYENVVKNSIEEFKGIYPKEHQTLQRALSGEGLKLFYTKLYSMHCLDGERLADILSIDELKEDDVRFWTAMFIMIGDNKASEEVPQSIAARIATIYYPEKYISLTDEEVISLTLDELDIPFDEKQSIWIKQSLIRGWIEKKLTKYTEDPYLQNYVFLRCVKQWLGLEYYMPKPIKYAELKSVTKKLKREYEAIDREEIEESQGIQVGEIEPEYTRQPQEKVLIEEKDSLGKQMPKRDPAKRKNAMILADFKCEIDPNHRTFISRGTGHPYVESHHLIPMEFYDDFDYSLDVEENIVCLCSNCHNEIHYGQENGRLVHILYEARKDLLHDVGLDITETELERKAYNIEA